MKKVLLPLCLLSLFNISNAQKFEVDTLYYSGTTENRINLVVLGDGYQEHELEKYAADAGKFAFAFIFQDPFFQYRNFFNVFAVRVPSNESGASHPGTAVDEMNYSGHPFKIVDNYFGSTFDHDGLHRLIFAKKTTEIANVLANNTPFYDTVLVLVNSPFYGGVGWFGNFAMATMNPLANDMSIHELGHSFVGLADEYYAGDRYAAESINMTQNNDPATVKWKNWYNLNGVGIFQHEGSEEARKWYKPHFNCKMNNINVSFCSVCSEAIVERIHSLVSPIDGFSPSDTQNPGGTFPMEFKLELIESRPSYLNIEWFLNGKSMDQQGDVLTLQESELLPGENILSVQVHDDSYLLKVDGHENIHMAVVQWKINSATLGIDDIDEEKIELSLFPNPTEGLFKLNIKAENAISYRLRLYDLNGKQILSKKHLMIGREETLNLDHLSPGTYVLFFTLDNGLVFSRKIIRQ